MAKYRISNGLAMAPKRDMKLLQKMSGKGWHVTGMRGILYRFEEGAPHPYDYSLNLEDRVTSDMMSLYRSAGWEPIVAEQGYQIFRAEAGASPIFSDWESETELLAANRKHYGLWSFILLVLLIICVVLSNVVEANAYVVTLLGFALLVCFIFTFAPFIGFSLSLHKRRKQHSR